MLVLLAAVGVALLIGVGYLAYLLGSKWLQQCQDADRMYEELMAKRKVQQEMDMAIVEAFKSELEEFKRVNKIQEQPYKGGTPSSACLSDQIEEELARIQEQREKRQRRRAMAYQRDDENDFRTIIHIENERQKEEERVMEMERMKRASEILFDWERQLAEGGYDDKEQEMETKMDFAGSKSA